MSDTSFVWFKNGMGDYATGTGAREEMLMMPFNVWAYRAGLIASETDLQVTERGAGANMSVDVSAGMCIVANSAYVANTENTTKYWGVKFTDTTNITIDPNTSGSTRIDIICVKINTSASPDDYAQNVASRLVVKGTAGGGTPATPSNYLRLAVITIPTGTTVSINTAMISNDGTFAYLNLGHGYVGPSEAILFDQSEDLHTLMYGGTQETGTPTSGDGWRLVYDQSYNGGSADFLVFEKTDGNQTNPDGGFAFLLTGNDGIQEESLVITGAGYVEVHDGNPLRVLDSTDTEFVEVLVGSNVTVQVSSGNFHIFDTDHNPILRVYAQGGGTQHMDMYHDGTSGVLASGTGDIHVYPAGGDFVIMDGGTVTLMNPASTANTQIYTDANNDFWLDPEANGDVIVFAREGKRAGGSTTYENVFRQTGWGSIQGDGTRSVTATITLPKAFASINYRVIISPVGEKVGAPTSDSDATSGGVFGMMATPASSSTFTANYFKTDAAGNTTVGTYALFHWEAIGAI